jgi:hypothetical protein
MRRLPGSHIPNIKNRSSKHLSWLTKIKPIVRSASNEQLQQWNNNNPDVTREIQRRAKKIKN